MIAVSPTAARPTRRCDTRRDGPRAVALALICALGLSVGCSSAQVEAKKRADKATFHYKLAAGYFHSHNVDLAIRELMKSLSFDAEHPDSRYLLGFILFGRKRYEEAISNFKRALKVKPRFFAARNHLGVTYLELERWQDAIRVLKPLLKEPTYTTPYLPYNNIGWAYLNLGQLPLADKHLRMAVFVNPRFCQGHRNLGLLAQKRRDLPGARAHFEEAVRRCPKVATFHFSLGNLYCTAHRGKAAQKAYDACRKLAPTTAIGRRCAARAELALNGGCP